MTLPAFRSDCVHVRLFEHFKHSGRVMPRIVGSLSGSDIRDRGLHDLAETLAMTPVVRGIVR